MARLLRWVLDEVTRREGAPPARLTISHPANWGPYKLDLGDGYLLHGTNPFNEGTVGGAVSHGCVRLTNADIDRLYHMVDTGTTVFIY